MKNNPNLIILDGSKSKPSELDCNNGLQALQDKWDLENTGYKFNRSESYPKIKEQLDLLYHDMTADKLDATGEWHKAIKKVKAYSLLLQEYFKVEHVYLFGSYAKQTQGEDSDIDVAVIVKNVDEDYFSVNPLLWKLRRQVDNRIEPILLEEDFDDSGFIKEVQKHGICIL